MSENVFSIRSSRRQDSRAAGAEVTASRAERGRSRISSPISGHPTRRLWSQDAVDGGRVGVLHNIVDIVPEEETLKRAVWILLAQ